MNDQESSLRQETEAQEPKAEKRPLSHEEKLIRDIDIIGIRMGLLFHGSDFILDNGLPIELWEHYEEEHTKALAKLAAKLLNMDDETPLLDAHNRTNEQQRVMMGLAAQEQINRIKAYKASNFFVSIGLFLDTFADALNIPRNELHQLEEWDDIADTCALLNRYFYATHRYIKPEEAAVFSDKRKNKKPHTTGAAEESQETEKPADSNSDQKASEEPAAAAAFSDKNYRDVKGIVSELIAYKQEHGGTYYEAIKPCFLSGAATITEIRQADSFGLPISKVWRVQGKIAEKGAKGTQVNVGRKTDNGTVIVKASISDRNGGKLSIDGILKGVQRAIGNLISSAGGINSLPITVTPQQIYRAYALLPPDTTVTDQQAQEMEKAMDVLMYAPAKLDFSAQLEKHKNIKQQDDYDYHDVRSGDMESPLILASKRRAKTRTGQIIGVAYTIYEVPILYMYSHIVNQIAYLPNTLLMAGDKGPIKSSAKQDARSTARNMSIRESVLSRVTGMKGRQKKKESYVHLIRVEEIAEDCGISLTDKTRRTLLKNTALYLDELKEKRTIKSYSETKEGRKLAGFTVKV